MALSAKSIYISGLTVLSAAGAAILSALGGWDDSCLLYTSDAADD